MNVPNKTIDNEPNTLPVLKRDIKLVIYPVLHVRISIVDDVYEDARENADRRWSNLCGLGDSN